MVQVILPVLAFVFVGVCVIWAAWLRLRPRKPMSLERFCWRAAERVLHRYQNLRILHVGDSYLELDSDAGPCTIHLDNAYAAARSKPGSVNKQIDLAIQAALEAGALSSKRDLEEIRDRILPILKPMRFVEASPRLLGDRLSLYWEPLGNDLAICYQLGDPFNPSYLGVEQFEEWRITPEELRKMALRNLSLRTDWSRIQRPKEDGSPALWACFQVYDGLDAARVLLPELHAQLSPILGGSFVVAVPHRDSLFACARSQQLIEMLAEVFSRERVSPGNRLSERFFLVTDEGVTEYEEIN